MNFLLVLLSTIQFVFAIDWDLNMCYEKQNLWPKECKKTLQAPIPLSKAIATLNTSISVRLNPGYLNPTTFTVANIGITWEIKPVNNSEHYIIVNRKHRYYLGAVYPHWESEHTLEGKRYCLEIQLVHYKFDFKQWETAAQTPGATYVISILFNISDCDNPSFDPFLQTYRKIYNKVHTPVLTRASLQGLLPTNNSYFCYEGSVPIPDCPENLIWHVYTEVLSISSKQLNIFKSILSEKGSHVKRSNRDLNEVNNRTVYYSKDQRC